ncbi:YihY/virulence factor BrkB family protein [Roseibium sp.]|uniref:YihY/virulence factor BrkB family protein n=1 Tax=Roseibium sp. TaxID=1936156 RepID=UPI003BAC3D6D
MQRLWQCAKAAIYQFNTSDGWAISSHIALSLMMAVFPFLIFATSLAGFFGKAERSDDIVNLVFEYWPDEIAEPIIREVHVVLGQGHTGFAALGIFLALVFASNGIEAVRVALNRAYGIEDRRPFWKQRIQSLLFVLCGSGLLFFVSALLVFIPLYFAFVAKASPTLHSNLFASESLGFIGAMAILIFVVFSCHYWLPARKQRLKKIWPGIVLTLVLWSCAASLFSAYLQMFANYSATYAGLASVMTAQIFLYIMGAILIYGAEFNAALERSSVSRSTLGAKQGEA